MPQLSWLEAEQNACFPPTTEALANPPGLLAAGGALTPEWLLTAYERGIFPWYSDGEPILWWSPEPRMVLLPGEMHLSRSFRKAYRQTPPTITVNGAFTRVIAACQAPRAREVERRWFEQQLPRQRRQLSFPDAVALNQAVSNRIYRGSLAEPLTDIVRDVADET